jgi:hypothetical protein
MEDGDVNVGMDLCVLPRLKPPTSGPPKRLQTCPRRRRPSPLSNDHGLGITTKEQREMKSGNPFGSASLWNDHDSTTQAEKSRQAYAYRYINIADSSIEQSVSVLFGCGSRVVGREASCTTTRGQIALANLPASNPKKVRTTACTIIQEDAGAISSSGLRQTTKLHRDMSQQHEQHRAANRPAVDARYISSRLWTCI